MSSRKAIREALASTLGDGIDDLRSHGYTPGQIHPPAAVVIELDQQPTTFSRDIHQYTAVVRLLTGGDMRASQEALDELADQVEGVIAADPTLGGVVDDAEWMRTRGDSEGVWEMGNQTGFATYTIVDFEVSVIG